MEAVVINTVAEGDLEIGVGDERAEESVGDILAGDISAGVLENDVGIPGVKFPSALSGLIGSAGEPVLIRVPVPGIPGIETEDHVVGEVFEIDPLACGVSSDTGGGFHLRPDGLPIIAAGF